MLSSVKSTLAAGVFLTGGGLFFGLQPAPVQTDSAQRVTVRFEEASFKQVAEWLEKQGLSFAIDKSEIDAEARVRLNANNVPVKDVLAALEKAWDGKWEKTGEIYVFKRSSPFQALRTWSSKDMPPITIPPQAFEFKFDRLDPKLEKELEQLAKKLADKGAEMGSSVGDEERMEQLSKEMEKRSEELERRIEIEKVQPKVYQFRAAPKAPPVPRAPLSPRSPTVPLVPSAPLDASKLIESLTAAQWERHRSRGHLTPSDLTPAQRKMLGKLEGKFEIRIKVNDRQITLKGE